MELKQPAEWTFVDSLRAPQEWRVSWNSTELHPEPEILNQVEDTEGLLQTAVASLHRFMQTKLPCAFPVTLRLVKTSWLPEAYELTVRKGTATVSAVDIEGVRRGIYDLIRQWQGSQTPVLPDQSIRRTPWLKRRISRCFFSPIQRPPANRDELLDENNYYPEAYLERLAASGINGLWISVELHQVSVTSMTGPATSDVLKRQAKLRKTVEVCRRYGIRIYLQMNEPQALEANHALFRKYPMLKGTKQFGRHCFCPSSPEGEAYLEESCRSIFAAVPGLGGIINITLGEGMTTCASGDYTQCPRCAKGPWKEILHRTWRAMRRGMDAVAPDADLISWLYLPEPKVLDERIFDLLHGAPQGVTVQLNCESGAVVEQGGKQYRVGDYWLSVPFPSENFCRFAQVAEEHHVAMSAKIQVGCSHEVATVPFVPVPGLLYRKYRELKRLKVSTVMQCWFFGNYPGIMNNAAGELAFEDFHDSEEEFLIRLARPDWGGQATKVAKIWMRLGKAYEHYPASNMFQYYGPVADGISWPLYYQHVNQGLTPTWLLQPEVNGDAIVEALMEISLPDAIRQMQVLSQQWHEAARDFTALKHAWENDHERMLDIGIAEALDLQFRSALNVLKFYDLRNQMDDIVQEEISHTEAMLTLTEQDARLGFHSEAEGYKYYPEKLKWRRRQLLALQGRDSYEVGSGWMQMENFRWKMDRSMSSRHLEVRVELKGHLKDMDEFCLALDDGGGHFPALLHVDVQGRIFAQSKVMKPAVNVDEHGWKVAVDVDTEAYSRRRPLRVNVLRLTDLYQKRFSWPPMTQLRRPRLNLIFYQPDCMGVLLESVPNCKSANGR